MSASSDIGLELTKRYLVDGYTVVGTYRRQGWTDAIVSQPHCHLFSCDITKKESVRRFISAYKRLRLPWETCISCISEPLPLTPFFSEDFDQWDQSLHINAIDQLRLVHGLYPLRTTDTKTNIVFFSAGGVMKPVRDFSAYTLSKILLIKICEYLAAENPLLNVFTVGPGWTKTKIHDLIINDPQVSKEMRDATKKFLQSTEETSMQDIYDCIRWLCSQDQRSVSGRNFFIPKDPWKGSNGKMLIRQLQQDTDMYKLRRHGDDFGRS